MRTTSSAYRTGHGKVSNRNTFGSAARRFIRECGSLVDRAPKSRVVFLTGTLPGSTPEAMIAIAAWSGWIVQTCLNWVRDYANDGRAFGVWEYQKRGALHLHMCVECPSIRQAENLKRRWKRRWIKVLDSVSLRSNTDVYARTDGDTWKNQKFIVRTDAQTVTKSVGCYLSKYLSKGSQKLRCSTAHAPSRWWFASKSLQREARQCRRDTVVAHLSLSDAVELYESISGSIAYHIDRVFCYVCEFDVRQKGCIGLAKPIQAHMLYEHLSAVLRCLQTTERSWSECKVPTSKLISTMFGGTLLSVNY